MEAVKPKKPRPKERAPVRETPPVPSRPAVVMGMRLPEVPQHEPCRTSSPEPEEVVLSDDEQPSTSTVVTETVDVPPSDEVLSNGTAIESEKRSQVQWSPVQMMQASRNLPGGPKLKPFLYEQPNPILVMGAFFG
ncbi:hypothetical protein OSTOST_11112 [Ostertagia ostertagi]